MSTRMAEVCGSTVTIDGLRFRYREAGFTLEIEATRIRAGETVALIGPSGVGKTTLLNLIAGVLVPDSGRVQVGELAVSALAESARRAFRREHVGLVFQELELLEYLSVRDNVSLQAVLAFASGAVARRASRLLALARACGIEGLLERLPRQLSQGERQRAALCRALLCEPPLVLADEPTGNLDPSHARAVVGILLADARARGATLLVVTHDHSLLAGFDRVIDFAEFRS